MSSQIAGYELLEDLGQIAWGRSWRARQISLDRNVQLTLLGPEEDCAGILPLARICAALTHPHLVSGIDLGETGEGLYLVTEWVEGPTVGEIVRRGGPIAEERALEIALAAARGLDHASRRGLVHGSVTPEALLIARGGTPRLRGFGADREVTASITDHRSPEQRRGEATDIRSDIYSLGTVLYLMLAGTDAFEDAPPARVVDGEVVEVPRPLAEAARRLHPDTVALVEKMMAWKADDRHHNAALLAEEIEALLERIEDRATISRTGTRRARPGARPIRRRRRR